MHGQALTRRRARSIFALDAAQKEASTIATEAEDKPAAQVIRDLMRAYVRQRKRRAFEVEAGRQSRIVADAARDPGSDEAQIMHEIEVLLADVDGWSA